MPAANVTADGLRSPDGFLWGASTALAAGTDRDRDAVIAGPTLPWNSVPSKGHANRIKMLKRRIFGHVGFELLRKRVLLA